MTKKKNVLSARSVRSALRPIKRKLGGQHKVIVHFEKQLSNVAIGAGDTFVPVMNEVFGKLDSALRKNEDLKGKLDHLYITVDAVLLKD